MFCKNCGNKLTDTAKFCTNCGTKKEITQTENNVNNINKNEEKSKIENISVEQNQNNNNSSYNQSININTVQNNTISAQEMPNQVTMSSANNQYKNNESDSKSLVSIILGIISIISAFFINILVLPIAIIGLIIAIMDKRGGGKKVAGIILNIIGIIAPIVIVIFAAVVLGFSTINLEPKIFKGDGYTLSYDENWVEGTVYEKDALAYEGEEDKFIVPIGKSAASDFSCDLSTIACQTQLYNEFYDLWSKELQKESLVLNKKSYGFLHLKEDIYYGTYNYGKSSLDTNGTFYIMFSNEKNVVLSFKVQSDNDNLEEVNKEVVELLKTIEIEKNTTTSSTTDKDSSSNVIVDNELSEILDSMSNWNRFSNLRTGDLGQISYITGGWRVLENSEEYWEFKQGQFWWYQSINNLNDNYWYGTTQILLGKEGLKSVGIDETKINNILTRANGKVTENDLYALVLTPTKIISGGVDKSSTNIPVGTKWKKVWILVDHGTEGIEAQTIDLDTAQTSYYVKVKD